MERFNLTASCRGMVKRLVKLIQGVGPDPNMKLAKPLGREAKFAPLKGEALKQPLSLERPEESIDGIAKREVFATIAQVNPNCVRVHSVSLRSVPFMSPSIRVGHGF